MSEDDFKELLYLYLDDEISCKDLKRLKEELAGNAVRLKEFQAECRMHQAMRMALDPSQPNDDKSAYSLFSQATSTELERDRAIEYSHFAGWLVAATLVASFTLSVALLSPELESDQEIVAEPSAGAGPAVELRRSDVRRYTETRRQKDTRQDSSLTAQFRLLGLRPEMLPQERNLRSVDLATVESREPVVMGLEAFQEAEQRPQLIPVPKILGFSETQSASSMSGSSWAGGFKSSLASY